MPKQTDSTDDAPDEGEGAETETDEEIPIADGTADGDALITCPYCGETVDIALDAGSGARQQYVEDCEVCCKPWLVTVYYGHDGHAEVQVSPLNE